MSQKNEMSKLWHVHLLQTAKMQQLRVKGMIIGIPKCDGTCLYADFRIVKGGHKHVVNIHEAEYRNWNDKHESLG